MRRTMPSNLGVAALLALAIPLASAPARTARAEPLLYRPAISSDGPASLRIDLPYTFGTHTFEVRDMHGELRVDWNAAPAVSGRLRVPLTGLRGGNDTLRCHMREAMGLDYAKSAFPGAHVCSDGQLPATGNNAVAFPEITFEIERAAFAGGRVRAGDHAGDYDTMRVIVTGRWTMHGIARQDTLDLRVTVPATGSALDPPWFRIEGLRRIHLADFGIHVKRAFVVTAGDDATVTFNLVLKQQPPPPPRPGQ